MPMTSSGGDAGDSPLQSYYGVDQIFGRDGNDSLGIIMSGPGNAVLDGGNGTDRFLA